jgi:hypothetical protein
MPAWKTLVKNEINYARLFDKKTFKKVFFKKTVYFGMYNGAQNNYTTIKIKNKTHSIMALIIAALSVFVLSFIILSVAALC